MSGIDIDVEKLIHEFSPNQSVPTLDIEELSFKSGQFTSLIGPSGCGKSTLLMILAGLLNPTEGNVKFADEPASGKPFRDMGVMFQGDLLLEWRSVMENVMLQAEIRGLPRGKMEKQAKELLSVAQLDGMEKSFPSELSGGMRQRVAVCRSLLHDPEVLLMDEPFAALDALTREKMGRFLGSLGEVAARTVVFVTHSIPEAVYLSDRVLVMGSDPGRIIDDVQIELPRPRTKRTPEVAAYQEYISYLRRYFEGEDDE